MKISIRLSLISRLVFFVSSPYPQALNLNDPPWGLIRKGGLFVKSNFRGGGLFERGLIGKWGLNRSFTVYYTHDDHFIKIVFETCQTPFFILLKNFSQQRYINSDNSKTSFEIFASFDIYEKSTTQLPPYLSQPKVFTKQ